MKSLVWITALLGFLAGCAALPSGVESVMSEAVEAARAPGTQQSVALARAEQAFLAEPTPLRRVRLAALLATLPAPLRDEARALELLAPAVDAGPGVGDFAALLSRQIAERQRLAREIERLTGELAVMQRERQVAEKERQAAEKERQVAEKERQAGEKERQVEEMEREKREEALRQQLEALRAIERGILEREERMRKRPRGAP